MDRENESRGCNSAALLIHAALFAYQKAHGRMVGDSSRAILRLALPYLIELLDMAGLPEMRKEKSIEENMSIYISMVKEGGYVVNASLIQKNDNSFVFEMMQCRFAFKGHRVYNDGCYICPFAILAAAVIYFKTGAPISVECSRLNETGSETLITVHRESQ